MRSPEENIPKVKDLRRYLTEEEKEVAAELQELLKIASDTLRTFEKAKESKVPTPLQGEE